MVDFYISLLIRNVVGVITTLRMITKIVSYANALLISKLLHGPNTFIMFPPCGHIQLIWEGNYGHPKDSVFGDAIDSFVLAEV